MEGLQDGPDRSRPVIAVLNPGCFAEVRVRELRRWLAELVTELAPETDTFTVRFTGDRGIRRYNREYRGKDAVTDVLSFPGEATIEGRHLGDVLISVPTAGRQAEGLRRSLDGELRRLILHGLLHCMGYDHETDDGAMSRLERSLTRRWIGEP